MATFLFDEIIFGPVKSRRLGNSLGINLLPIDKKVCNFNCLYCECGWNTLVGETVLPARGEVAALLSKKLETMRENNDLPDVITFAGNGEPTLHPDFEGIIDDTIAIRNQFAPRCSIAVLTNSTTLHKPSIRSALSKVDKPYLKIDSAQEKSISIINKPLTPIDLNLLAGYIRELGSKAIIQTMFVRGVVDGTAFDNTTDAEITALSEFYNQIRAGAIFIYSIARDTPLDTIEQIPSEELHSIALKFKQMGIEVRVS